jgi:hypothetical protein
MRRLITIAAALIAGAAGADANPLNSEIGRTRPVVVVAADAERHVMSELRQALAIPGTVSALAERQLVVFTVIGGQGARDSAPMGAKATASLLGALGVRADGPDVVLLIGKDGGVKLRMNCFTLAKILGAVDQMPMRRQEIRRQ